MKGRIFAYALQIAFALSHPLQKSLTITFEEGARNLKLQPRMVNLSISLPKFATGELNPDALFAIILSTHPATKCKKNSSQVLYQTHEFLSIVKTG
ncbi:MAG: hypothetical protein AAB445_01955 [Patescibacteria group bacterium]